MYRSKYYRHSGGPGGQNKVGENMGETSPKVIVVFPESMMFHMDLVASLEHRSRSSLIREAVRAYLKNSGVPAIPALKAKPQGNPKKAKNEQRMSVVAPVIADLAQRVRQKSIYE